MRLAKCLPDVRARAVRMVFEHRAEYASEWAVITSIAAKIGCKAETLRLWVRLAQRDLDLREVRATDERCCDLRDFLHPMLESGCSNGDLA